MWIVSPTEALRHACKKFYSNQTPIPNLHFPSPAESLFIQFSAQTFRQADLLKGWVDFGNRDVDQSPGAQVVKCQRSEVQKQRAIGRNGSKNKKTTTAVGGGHSNEIQRIEESTESRKGNCYYWVGRAFWSQKSGLGNGNLSFDRRSTGLFGNLCHLALTRHFQHPVTFIWPSQNRFKRTMAVSLNQLQGVI